MMIDVPNSRFRFSISSRICAWIVTSSAVVGSSAISTFGLQASAAAIIARWRMPPENWCGYSSARRRGSGMLTLCSISTASSRAARLAELLVQHRSFRDLLADGQHRVQRGHRILEDHRDLVAPDRAHPLLVELQQVLAVVADRAARDHRRRRRDQLQHRHRRHALAAARLARRCPSVSPRRRSKLTPSTARMMPSRFANHTFRSSTSTIASRAAECGHGIHLKAAARSSGRACRAARRPAG